MPEKLTPHSLRRTFISLLLAIREDPVYVSVQVGHDNPSFTLRIYAQVMRRGDDWKRELRALVRGVALAPLPVELARAA